MLQKFTAWLFVFAAILSSAHSARADIVATTTISFDPVTVDGDTFDSLVMDWSTPVMSGIINESALTALTFSIFNGDALVYQDIAIENGVEQPIGGVARGPGDIEFHFDIDSMILIPNPINERSWDNDHDVRQYQGVGTNWNVYAATDRPSAFFDKTIGNDFRGRAEAPFSQSTVLAVPEPSSVGVLAAIGFVFLARRRR